MRTDPDTQSLAGLLRQLRLTANLSQTEMAEHLEVSQSFVCEVERQGRALRHERRLSRWLDVCAATDAERLLALRLAGEPSDDTEPETAPLT